MGILRREEALARVVKSRQEMSESSMIGIFEAVAQNIEKAVVGKKLSISFTCDRGFTSIEDIQASVGTELENLGYLDFEITMAKRKKDAWFRINFEEESKKVKDK